MAEMKSLRVNTGVKRIEVNDNGDYIVINLSDNSFFTRFNSFLNWLNTKQAELDASEWATGKEPDALMVFDGYRTLCKETCERLDDFFGDGCCSKVFFGIEEPGIELIVDFLDQIIPILNDFAKERSENIRLKYSKNRKGAASRK